MLLIWASALQHSFPLKSLMDPCTQFTFCAAAFSVFITVISKLLGNSNILSYGSLVSVESFPFDYILHLLDSSHIPYFLTDEHYVQTKIPLLSFINVHGLFCWVPIANTSAKLIC